MIDLYTFPTTSGQRVAIMLEEIGEPYRTHKIDIVAGEQRKPEFLTLNPFGHIPVVVDRAGPSGADITLAESGAIVLYLAEKAGKLLPRDTAQKALTVSWVLFGVSTMNAAFSNYLRFAVLMLEKNQSAITLFEQDVVSFLKVFDKYLATRRFIIGDEYTAADVSVFPPIAWLTDMPIGIENLSNLQRWHDAVAARPAVEKGMAVGA